MDINEWKELFVCAVNTRFPTKFTTEQRLLAILRQVSDVSERVQFGKGTKEELRHRIAAIFPDLFMLCEDQGVELDEELQRVMDWFKSTKGYTNK